MAFTESDLTALRAARLKLATGQQVQRVRYSDGSEVNYGSASIAEMDRLINEAAASLSAAGSTIRRRHIRVIASKGL